MRQSLSHAASKPSPLTQDSVDVCLRSRVLSTLAAIVAITCRHKHTDVHPAAQSHTTPNPDSLEKRPFKPHS